MDKMPQQRMQSRRTTTTKIPMDKLEGLFFANQFQIEDPQKSYSGIKFALQYGQEHTTPAVGKHHFSAGLPVTQKFLGLLTWFKGKDKMELKNLFVVETGLGSRDAKLHTFDAVEEGLMRIVINLREEESIVAPRYVGLGITIKDKKGKEHTTWMTSRSSHGSLLPGSATQLAILSGNGVIPTTRHDNNKSIYVIMDIVPLKDTQYIAADNIMTQSDTTKEQFIGILKNLHQQGKIPTDKLQEMMKDPQAALAKLMSEEEAVDPLLVAKPKDTKEEEEEVTKIDAREKCDDNDDTMGTRNDSII